MHSRIVNPQSARLSELVKASTVELIDRIEQARESIGWSGRELARAAGLKYDSHYSVVVRNLRGGGTAHAETIDKIVSALVAKGCSEEWLRRGTGAMQSYQRGTKRGFTPTPAPLSEMRSSNHPHLVVPSSPNRERAANLLESRGYDPAIIDEQLALAAFDARLAPCEDPPVSWWIDALRDRLGSQA